MTDPNELVERHGIEDGLNRHFGETGLLDWCALGEEARRVLAMVGYEYEEDSPIDALVYAVAAQAFRGGAVSLARSLGLSITDDEAEEKATDYADGSVEPQAPPCS